MLEFELSSNRALVFCLKYVSKLFNPFLSFLQQFLHQSIQKVLLKIVQVVGELMKLFQNCFFILNNKTVALGLAQMSLVLCSRVDFELP